MANEVGTASNLEDLFGKIVSFLNTNASLVAANQHWTILRQHRDNVAGLTTNLTENATAQNRRILHSFRYDPRSLNTNNPNSVEGHVLATNYAQGTSHITMTLRVAKEVKNVRMVAPNSNDANNMLQNFRLQYSDDNSSYTTALTVSSNPSYSMNGMKDWAVPGTPGSHLYWRIIIDRKVDGATTGTVTWKNMILQLADGTIANHFGSEVILKARGNGASENIFTGIRSEYDSVNGWYNLFLNGFTGYDSNVLGFWDQPGSISPYGSVSPMVVPMVPCWNSSMGYWFAANGRSFRFGLKVSTSIEGGYMGFFLPYSTPTQYPYPMAIGGSLSPPDTTRGTEWRYSYSSSKHSLFPIPYSLYNTSPVSDATLYMRTPDGVWGSVGQRSSSYDAAAITGMTIAASSPFALAGPARGVWPSVVREPIDRRRDYREVLGGGYILQPLVLLQRLPSPAVWGELEGVYAISGFNNSSENTTTWNGVNQVVLQNASRTEVHEFWALALPA